MLRLGAHVSISGGAAKAVEREAELGGNAGQIFVGSPRTWSVGEIGDEEAAQFREATTEEDIGPWIVHGTYLINLATPKPDLGEKSVETIQAELEATAALGIDYYTFHPGAHTGAGVEAGIENVAERISRLDIPEETTLLIENTAGGGTKIGATFEQLALMIEASTKEYGTLGVCLDTCHLLAAGYDLRTESGMHDLMTELQATIGAEHVKYLHLNDSKHPLDSGKDEHAHIGEGEIGEEGFRRFINHEEFFEKPMVLETPETDKGYGWNIEKVQSLYGGED